MPKKTQHWKQELEDWKRSQLILLGLTCFRYVSTYSNLPIFESELVTAGRKFWSVSLFLTRRQGHLEGSVPVSPKWNLFQICIAFPSYFALNVKGKIDEIDTVVHGQQYCLGFASRIYCWWTSVKGQDFNSVPQASPLWHVEHVQWFCGRRKQLQNSEILHDSVILISLI